MKIIERRRTVGVQARAPCKHGRSAGSVQGVLSAHTGDGGVHVSSPNVGALKDVRTTATEASATSVVAQEFVCMDAIAISVTNMTCKHSRH